jgi:hypothetical protein
VKRCSRSGGVDAEAAFALVAESNRAHLRRFEAGLKDGAPVPVALTIEMTFAISNEVTSANPSRLRLVVAPYNALRKAARAFCRFVSWPVASSFERLPRPIRRRARSSQARQSRTVEAAA